MNEKKCLGCGRDTSAIQTIRLKVPGGGYEDICPDCLTPEMLSQLPKRILDSGVLEFNANVKED